MAEEEGIFRGVQLGKPIDNLPPTDQMLLELPPEMQARIQEIMKGGGDGKPGLLTAAIREESRELIGTFWSVTHRGDERAERFITFQNKDTKTLGLTMEQIAVIATGAGLAGSGAFAGGGAAAGGETAAGGAGTFTGTGAAVPVGGGGALTGGGPFGMGGGTAVGGGGGAASFFSNPFTNLGINLGTGILNQQAFGQTNKANQKATEARIAQALAQLTPEAIAQLTQQFIPEIAAITNPQFQAQQQALQTAGARAGFTGNQADTNLQQTLQAGLRGQQINANAQLAFTNALNLGGQRASAVTGGPFVPIQNAGSLGQPIQNSFNQFLQQQSILNQQKQPQSSGAPFTFPGIPLGNGRFGQ